MSQYEEGAILTLKKAHPCGSKEWKVLRTGWEYRLQCTGCDHIILMRREQLEKLVRLRQTHERTDCEQNSHI